MAVLPSFSVKAQVRETKPAGTRRAALEREWGRKGGQWAKAGYPFCEPSLDFLTAAVLQPFQFHSSSDTHTPKPSVNPVLSFWTAAVLQPFHSSSDTQATCFGEPHLSELLLFYSLSTLHQTHTCSCEPSHIFLNCCCFTAFPVPLFLRHTHVQTFCGPPLVFLNCCFTAFPLFIRHTRVQTPTLQPQILHFLPTLFMSETTCPPVSDTMLLSLLSQTQDISLLWIL